MIDTKKLLERLKKENYQAKREIAVEHRVFIAVKEAKEQLLFDFERQLDMIEKSLQEEKSNE